MKIWRLKYNGKKEKKGKLPRQFIEGFGKGLCKAVNCYNSNSNKNKILKFFTQVAGQGCFKKKGATLGGTVLDLFNHLFQTPNRQRGAGAKCGKIWDSWFNGAPTAPNRNFFSPFQQQGFLIQLTEFDRQKAINEQNIKRSQKAA
ncbi:MAG: hypothetical protein CM15mV61_120 [uncultured marine virus]|nr:MAG: hypothetical protein CM15mV61_120 [uncultured marine virus]